MEHNAYDSRYLEGIRYFNACDFFEAHEVWESVWTEEQGPARRFYQGLIQVAVCLHHFGNGNARGARKLYHTSRGYLEDYRPCFLGLNVERLLGDLERCCAALLSNHDDFPQVRVCPELIPEIHLNPLPDAKP